MVSIDPEMRRALVTGAASGIGAAFAARLAEEKYDLWLVDKQDGSLVALARDLEERHGVTVTPIVADLRNDADLDAVVDVVSSLPALDLLINNAGFGEPALFHDVAPENHVAMLKVHVVAPVRLCRAALPAMIASKKGGIINVSALAQHLYTPGNTMYGVTKLFLDSLSRRISLEVRQHGINVQSLLPGFTRTPFGETKAYKRSPLGIVPGFLWSSPESVVDASWRTLGSGRVTCIPGRLNRVLYFLMKNGLFWPRLLRRWIA